MQMNELYSKISGNLRKLFHFIETMGRKLFTPIVLFILILGLGIFARVWEFPQLPPGLNQDEASIGIEAYDLLHFGVDRNGISFPVNFVSWCYGMDALYGYVLIPFVAFGLTPLTIRLPSLLTGILTLPIIYLIGKRSSSETFGLLSMFLLAISPWHILMSRWGLNENILSFVFGLGFLCLLFSTPKNGWFIAAAAFFGLSLYVYGVTYVAVPIFLACAIPIMVVAKRVSKKNLVIGLFVFTAFMLPIFLFVLINAFGWNSIHLGPVTIPRLICGARFMDMSPISQTNPIKEMVYNIYVMVKLLLIYQTDRQVWNVVEPFGYMYSFSFPLAVIGSIFLFPFRSSKNIPERLLILAWLLASLVIGIFIYANINRIHLVFIPIILCVAFFLTWLGDRSKFALSVMILIYLTSFFTFSTVYHGKDYLKQANQAFFAGLIPALEDARQLNDNPICVTFKINQPLIYVLLIEKMDHAFFFEQVNSENPGGSGYPQFGRYTFGIENCPSDLSTIYILSKDEQPPNNGVRYQIKEYDSFNVYYP